MGLCCVGILAPSSIGGVPSSGLPALVILGMLAFSILLILISERLSSRWGLLLGAVYGGLWVFLRGTVRNKRVAVWLWAVTIAFELGLSALLVPRVIAVIMLTALCLSDIYVGDRETTLTRSGVSCELRQHDDLAKQKRYPR